jgi:hypothetical protein
VPDLRLSEEWLHPDLALAHRFLIGLGGVIGPHLVQVLGIERAMDDAAAAAFGAVRLERTGIAGRGIGPVDDDALGVLDPLACQCVTCRAVIPVLRGFVGEVVLAVNGRQWFMSGKGT